MFEQLKVQELRDALSQRGLDTKGNKAVLVARLNAYEETNDSSESKENVKRLVVKSEAEEPVRKRVKTDEAAEESEQKKPVDQMTVVELRAELVKRGIATNGTKRTLHSRLSEAMQAEGAPVKMEEAEEVNVKTEEAGKECDGREYGKTENTVVVTKKGRAVLDNHIPDTIKSKCHVLEMGNDVYDAILNQTNVGQNNNKFFILQVLESDSGNGPYYVYYRWGRVGARGQDKLFGPYPEIDSAINEFEAKFYDKTKNRWEDRLSFEPVPNKYTWLERDYAEEEEKPKKDENKIQKAPKETKLDKRLAQFINHICNLDMMRQQMMEIGYDANKMPLGKLSKSTILKGYESLKKIAAVLEGSSKASLQQLSSEFYTVIPHDFGFQNMRNFVIDTHAKLKRKLEMVESLGEIQLATKLLQTEDEEDPAHRRYEQLNCHLEPLSHDSEEFHLVEEYLHNTHGKTHSQYGLEIIDVFKAIKVSEDERYQKFSTVKNRMLLWHGSRLSNWTGILSQGLRIAPPEAPVTGYMFGKGVYFADMVSKSANYCYTSKMDPVGVLLLCEVALGDMRELYQADYNADRLPEGKLSTKGVGGTEPDPKGYKVLPDGVVVPMGKPLGKKNIQGALLYNEYIVYDVAQIRMRYVLQVKFNYR